MLMDQIVLRLARNARFPKGDEGQGNVVIARVDASERQDVNQCRQNRTASTIVRFRPGNERDADRWPRRDGADWLFHCDAIGKGKGEPVFRLGDRRPRVGGDLTVWENDGGKQLCRVEQRTAIHPPPRHGHPEKKAGKVLA